MPRGKILSDKEQGQVIAFNELGLSQREIVKKIGRAQSAICNFLKVIF